MIDNVYKDLPIGFHRLSSTPLDKSSVQYGTVIDVLNYANSGTVYNGQNIIMQYPNGYQENITFNKVNDKLVPTFKLPNGFEFITLNYSGDVYIMVYFYNKGTPYSSKNDNIRFTDPLAWAMLPQASLIAGSMTNLSYLLKVDNKVFLFDQDNFIFYPKTEFVTDTKMVNSIYDIENDFSFYATNNLTAHIMPKVKIDECVRLYVKGNEFAQTIF